MDNFNIIYKILSFLEKSMDVEDPDFSMLDAEALRISETRWRAIWKMLIDDGYVSGVKYVSTKCGDSVHFLQPAITIKGLEYLENNTFMKKAYNMAKGIVDLIP